MQIQKEIWTNNVLPVVTVGIPTYNRPASLKKTLDDITGQTYSALEIIVSDNCSQGDATRLLLNQYQQIDPRIKSFTQSSNQGPFNNFKFVLAKATGEYFMWAADDDRWAEDFIEKIMMYHLENQGNYVAVTTEAQYTSEKGENYPFFAEGKPFYRFYSESKLARLKHMLNYNYGNLVYSIFRTKVIQRADVVFLENEIPFLMQMAEQGNFRVLPSVAFNKKSPSYQTYLQAKWEKVGGRLPNQAKGDNYINKLKFIFFYHLTVFRNTKKIIVDTNISACQKTVLNFWSAIYLSKHACNIALGFKKSKT